MAFGVANDPLQAVLDADAALRMVETTDDPARAGYLLIHREMASALAGHGVAWDRLDEGIRLEGGGQVPGRGPSSPPLVLFTMCDKPDEARARFVVDDRWYASRGEEGWQAERAGQLALVELRAGNTDAARSLANDACERLDRLQVGGGWPLVYAWRSLVDAHTGRAGRALETTAGLLEDLGSTLWTAIVHSVAVFASHAQGDEPRALEHAVRMRAILESLGIADLLADRSEPVLAELRAATGDIAGAADELQRLEQRHASLPRPWTAAALPRTRAAALAARGDIDGALAALATADALAPTVPHEAAWNQLAHGRLLRRIRDKRKAAAVLQEARSAFGRLGATDWVAMADAELARVGLRRRPPNELTDSELVIARLAAQGLTSREIAAAAFVSPKTVEANLTRIYRKLDIGSRAQLGAWIQQREGSKGQT